MTIGDAKGGKTERWKKLATQREREREREEG